MHIFLNKKGRVVLKKGQQNDCIFLNYDLTIVYVKKKRYDQIKENDEKKIDSGLKSQLCQ